MSPDTVLAKSLIGLEEIEARSRGLHPRLRQALVRVDGTRTIRELVAEAGPLGELVAAQIEELVRLGYVIDASQPRALDIRVLTLLKIQLGDLVTENVGFPAPALCAGLQRCRTANDLLRWVDWAFTHLPGFEDPEVALRFHRRARQTIAALSASPAASDEGRKALREFPQIVRE
jgi:hypothetical protein